MGYKRKRTYTRNSIASSESGEDETFLNNSDYEMDGEQKEYLIKSTENVDHRDQRPTDMLSSAEGDLVNSDQLIQKHLNHQEDQEVDCECTNGETADLKDQDSNATHFAKSVAFEEGSLPPSQLSQSKMPLSYSEQKSEVIIQSPTKRRDNYISAVPSNEPRLVIKKLILTNFKSYAGEQEIGPFSPSFSAVVGPNGSGKSNVIDSLLFVFGFRASKMRQGKLSELIHNSSGGEKLPFCQVDIHFHSVLDADSHKAAHVISNSELVVSRKALKNNHSQYYIDGKTSSYSEVTKLLSDKGIDLHHKRFLILQGEVESIAQMKAKAERENEDGLLEYLEDIIGTAKYKDLIEQNLGRMEDLNNVCVEKENRVSLVEKDKDSLEQKKNEALRLLETEKILAIKKSITLQAQILRSRKFIDEEELVIKEMTNRLLKEKEANKVLTDSINEIVAEQNAVLKEMSSLDKNLIPLTKRQRAINKSKVSIEERVKNLTNKIRKSQKSKDQSEHIFTSASHQLEGTKELMSKYNEEILSLTTELEKEKSSLSELREQMKNKTSHLSSKIESYQTKLEPWNDKLKEKESMIHLVTSELEILQNQKDSLNRRLEGARKHLLDIKSSGQQREQELVEAESKLSKIDNQIALGEAQLANDKQEIDSRLHRLNGLRQKTQDSLNSFSNQQNKSRVLSSLQRLARSGRIEGFYGKLGDLGVIDDKYDIAISTACPGLDSIVVETVETAQACIDYLRKNKLGYANFICLNKLRDFNLSIIQTPGNPITVKRLFDLIRPVDPKFARAFYSKIFNTLVASDLSEAKKIAFGPKRWKVVTLDGKVVDTSGTMSGGGSFVAKGGMRLANSGSVENVLSEEEAETLKKRLSYEESDFERISVENQEKIQRYRKLKEMKPETEFRISKLRLDIEALVQEKRQASSILRSMVTERDENDNDTKKLDETIVQKTAERDILCREKEDLKSSMFELESNVKELEEQILEAGGVELRLQNSKVDSIKQQIEIVNEKCSNEKLSLRKTENDLNRHKKIVGELNEEILKVEAELNSIEDEKVSKDKESKSVSDEIETISAQKDVKEQEAERLREKKEEMLSSINEFKSTEIEIENQIEKHVDQVKKDEKRRQAFDIELRDLVIRDTSPYIFWLEGEEKMKYDRTTFENLPEDQLNSLDIEIIEKEVEELERHMDSIKVDVEVLKEYGLKKTEFESRRVDLNSAVEERDLLRSHCEDLKRRRLDEFMEGFNTISMSLKEMYQMITMGGNAELELVDSLDPFSEGIMFSVMPPKKSWKNITNLSGGEKTLSSLALVFALHKYKPTPLYVMDEIDAALDFRNVSIVANYIKERTKNAQFVVISLRNNMFELAQQLVGIYKINNKTKSISLQNKDFSVPA